MRTVGRVGAYAISTRRIFGQFFWNWRGGGELKHFAYPGIVRSVVGAARNAAQATRNTGDVRKAMRKLPYRLLLLPCLHRATPGSTSCC